MDRGAARTTLSVGIALALCGCDGQIAETATRPAAGGAVATRPAAGGAVATRPAAGGAADASSSGSPEGLPAHVGVRDTLKATCPATPAQLVDFNVLANQLGASAIGGVQLAADATSIYLVFGGALLRVPIQAATFSTLLKLGPPDEGQYDDPVATSTAVVLHHLTGTGNDEIVSVPKAGGPPTTLATSQGNVYGFAATDSAVYFVDQDGLKSAASTGGGGVVVLSDAIPGQAGGLAVVGSSVVVTTTDTGGRAAGSIRCPSREELRRRSRRRALRFRWRAAPTCAGGQGATPLPPPRTRRVPVLDSSRGWPTAA